MGSLTDLDKVLSTLEIQYRGRKVRARVSEHEFNEHLYSRSMSPAVLRAHILG